MRLFKLLALVSLAACAALSMGTAFVRSAIASPIVWLLSALTFPSPYARHHDHLIPGHPRSPRYAA